MEQSKDLPTDEFRLRTKVAQYLFAYDLTPDVSYLELERLYTSYGYERVDDDEVVRQRKVLGLN